MGQHILVVGKSFSRIKQHLTDNAYDFTVLRDAHTAKSPEKKLKNRVVCDFSSYDKVIDTVDKLNKCKRIDAILVVYEDYIRSAALISNHLGLPGLSIESAEACTDKEKMRQLFALAPEKISPGFAVITSHEQLLAFGASHNFPLIIKPANLSKSLLVSKCNDQEELLAAYEKTMRVISDVYKKYAPRSTPKLLVEEFMEGSIHSVDAFVDAEGMPHILENVVDYQTGHDIGYDDNFHYSRLLPSRLQSDQIEAIRHTAAVGCQALGMTSSPAHVEIILTTNGPRIVEIGARNGGYRERMHWLANGIDITANALALSLNKPLAIKPKKNDCVGVFELFPKKPGTFIGIVGQEQLEKLASFKYLSVKSKPGQFVGKAGEGYKMSAVAILANSDSLQFYRDRTYLDTDVSVKVSI